MFSTNHPGFRRSNGVSKPGWTGALPAIVRLGLKIQLAWYKRLIQFYNKSKWNKTYRQIIFYTLGEFSNATLFKLRNELRCLFQIVHVIIWLYHVQDNDKNRSPVTIGRFCALGRCVFIFKHVKMVKRDLILILFQFLHFIWVDTPKKTYKLILKSKFHVLNFRSAIAQSACCKLPSSLAASDRHGWIILSFACTFCSQMITCTIIHQNIFS